MALERIGGDLCNWPVEREHYREIGCGRPALLYVYRRKLPALLVCARHMDDPAVYAHVAEHGYRWRLLRSSEDPMPAT